MQRVFGLWALLAACTACGVQAIPGTHVSMSFGRPHDLYDAPFPSDDLLQSGRVDLHAFPNPSYIPLINDALQLVGRDAHGFALSGGVFFRLTGQVNRAELPSLQGSTAPDSLVFLVSVTPGARDYGKRYPIQVRFEADGGPFGAADLLSLVPLQGIVLWPHTTYAAVVLRRLHDASGQRLGVSLTMAHLAAGDRVRSLTAATQQHYEQALDVLRLFGVRARSIAGLAVFTTDDPTAGMQLALHRVSAGPLPPLLKPWQPEEVFADYCVYESELSLPDYQSGTPPYTSEGGDWHLDAEGAPVLDHTEASRIFVTLPRQPMPPAGFPTVLFVRTGAGGDRPLVDRGVQAVHNGPPLVSGSGPAQEFARVGWAGVMVDGPLGGIRNRTGGDEQFLVFNFLNPAALRDNVRESALELALVSHRIGQLHLPTGCPGLSVPAGSHPVLDPTHLVIMGHSMGATIAPLAAAFEPRFAGLILSGAGGSYMDNVLYKEKPLDVRPMAELLLGYTDAHRTLRQDDPVLTLVQWALEPADPMVYARDIVTHSPTGSARDVLMLQGIVDHYIMPPIANALSLALGLDLAGTPLDATTPELAGFTPLGALLPFSGRRALSLPVAGNYPGVTAVVVQHPGDGVEDGHEVVFQTEPPKVEYRCFLADLAAGRVPEVVAKDSTGCL